jgi:hypothetical protein
MIRKPIARLVSILLAVSSAACAQGNGTSGGSSGVGEGSALAASGATAAGTPCPAVVTADSSNCRWEVDRRTREAMLVCVVGAQTFRVDSSGVGEGR